MPPLDSRHRRLRIPGHSSVHRDLCLSPFESKRESRRLFPGQPLSRRLRISLFALWHQHDGLRHPWLVRSCFQQWHRHLRTDGFVIRTHYSPFDFFYRHAGLGAGEEIRLHHSRADVSRSLECGHIGTVIFVAQAALLVPYIIIGIMGGGTTLYAISGGLVPYWFGGGIVALVVMGYVFFGGMRGTAWVNTFQTTLFMLFGTAALIIIGAGMGGYRNSAQAMLSSPTFSALLTRERISPLYFFSYTFIPLSAIAFPHILIFCLTARRMAHFKKTIIFYPLCILALWLPCVFLGVMANRVTDVPQIRAKQEARRVLATQGKTMTPEKRDELREQAAGDDVILLLLQRYAPLWLAGLLGAGIMAAVMASDSQILALSTMFTEDFFAFYGAKKRFGEAVQVQTGRLFIVLITLVAYAVALRAPETSFELAS